MLADSAKISLPGSQYGLGISDTKATDAKLFISRYSLTTFVKSLLPSSAVIAEVGVFHGYFSDYLYHLFDPSVMFLIDTFNTHDFISGLFTTDNHFSYIKNKVDGKRVHCMQGYSWDMLNNLSTNSVDYIYIDADHSYESVKKDISAAYNAIKHNGIIQFNDYCNFSILENDTYGVMQAVNEFLSSYDIKIIGISLDKSGYHDLAVQVYKRRKLHIVTPCSRPQNLEKIKNSINFDLIDSWHIIYDTRNQLFVKRFNHPKIIESECKKDGVVGHPIRNMALDTIKDGLIYYLDDDNIVHYNFWNICSNFSCNNIYLFDQQRGSEVLKGNNPTVDNIDTAQYVFDSKLVNNLRFDINRYNADGLFIETLCKQNPNKITYIDKICANYNFLV
jgi:hypothetical protein